MDTIGKTILETSIQVITMAAYAWACVALDLGRLLHLVITLSMACVHQGR